MTTGTRKAGDFCWINMLTPQPTQAREFFGALLDWTYAEIPGLGHTMKVGGHDIGGLFDLAGPNTKPGTPPVIGVMVKVESADATCERVIALGGTARPPFDIMGNLRMAMCFDPNGAEFDIWESRAQGGTEVDNSLHGAPSWFETLTTDTDRAGAFYSRLFGWTTEMMPMPGMTYTTFKLGTKYVAGMMQISAETGEMPAHWGTTFTVKSADDAARQAVALGATIHAPLHDIPGTGRFCGITSPQGVRFFVIEYRR